MTSIASQNICVLFVCMGNICRSPSAEGYFLHHLSQSNLTGVVQTDSAGTHSYHVGHAPDERAIETMHGRGVDISGLRARKVTERDFHDFDHIIAMDEANLRLLKQVRQRSGDSRAKLSLMLSHSPISGEPREVPDPYYGGMDGFEYMCDLLDRATKGLLDDINKSLQQNNRPSQRDRSGV